MEYRVGGLWCEVVFLDVDQEIDVEKIPAEQKRVRHIGAVVERDQHLLADVLPLQGEPHHVTPVKLTVFEDAGANSHGVGDSSFDPLALAVFALDPKANFLSNVCPSTGRLIDNFQFL